MEKQYYNHVNLLRGIAAFIVCVFHFTNLNTIHGELFDEISIIRVIGSFGYTGVFIFFVLSGFVIPISLQKSEFGLKRLPRFLARRYVRIEIPYLCSILLILLVGIIFSVVNEKPFDFDLGRFVSHLFYVVSFTNYEWYNDVYWTLAIEIQFYLFMALTFFILNKSKYGSVAFLFALILLSCVVTDRRILFHFMPCFASGIGCWLYKQKKIEYRLFMLLIIASFGAAWYTFEFANAVAILFSVLFILFVPEMKNRTFTIGKISYSLYLTHGVIGGNVIYFLVNKVHSFGGSLLVFACAILSSLVFAYIFYRLVEKPSQDLSRKIGN